MAGESFDSYSSIAGIGQQEREYYLRKLVSKFPEKASDPSLVYGDPKLTWLRLYNEGVINDIVEPSDLIAEIDSIESGLSKALYERFSGITFIEVEKSRLKSDKSDTERLQRAVNKATTFGIPCVRALGPEYIVNSRINIAGTKNLVIQGVGNKYVTIRSGAPDGTNIFSIAGGFDNIVIEGFNFEGTAIERPTEPTRRRTFGPNPIESAIYMMGDKTLSQASNSVIMNVTVRQCRFYGTKGLPLWLSGIRGITRVEDNIFDNCLDVGLLYLEQAIFSRNQVYRGQDNGVSVSRGCSNVLVDHNYFENCAYWAVFTGGFLSDDDRTKEAHLGPVNVIVSNNIGKGMGNGGLYGGVAPKRLKVHDNLFMDIRRGPVDIPSDSYGMGFWIGGLSDGASGYVSWAEDVDLHDNTVIDCPAGGVWINGGVKRLKGHHNTFINPGSKYRSDGTTLITPSDVNSNYGFLANGTNEDIQVHTNTILDLRQEPYLNNPVNLKTAKNPLVYQNTARGNRVPLVESAFNYNVKELSFVNSASIKRATLGVDGSNVSLKLYSLEGELVAEPIRIRVTDGVIVMQTPVLFSDAVRIPAYTTELRPKNSLAEGSMIFDSTLGKPLWKKGSVWVDGAGTTV